MKMETYPITQYEYFAKPETPDQLIIDVASYSEDVYTGSGKAIFQLYKDTLKQKYNKFQAAYLVSKAVFDDNNIKAKDNKDKRLKTLGIEDRNDSTEEEHEMIWDIHVEEEDKLNVSFLRDLHWKAERMLANDMLEKIKGHIPEETRLILKEKWYWPKARDDFIKLCLVKGKYDKISKSNIRI